ncbi:phospholipase D-like domain-containing protein [Geodermatophilus sp. SYSU D01176]
MTAALTDRADTGVRVRLLLDGYGARHTDRSRLASLRAAGCQVFFYRPLPSWRPTVWNLRTHRRVLVCDATVALTGGTGMADTWTGDRPAPGFLAGHRRPGVRPGRGRPAGGVRRSVDAGGGRAGRGRSDLAR